MSLKEEVSAQMKEAMKAKDAVKVSCLRMVLAALKNREIEQKGELTDAECLKVLTKLAKQRGESIEMFRKGGREELAAREEAELKILETYLPAAATGEEMDKAIDAAISETGATSMKEMGQVMKAAKEALSGKDVDGKTLSGKVKAKLQP